MSDDHFTVKPVRQTMSPLEEAYSQVIFAELLRFPKGEQFPFFISGSRAMSRPEARKLRVNLQNRFKHARIPYKIYFYNGGPGLVGWMFYTEEGCTPEEVKLMRVRKAVFDKNAEMGIYPKVKGYRWTGKYAKEKEDWDE